MITDLNTYFSTISSLASKFVVDCEIVKQSCIRNGRWDGLSVEQQEDLLDSFIIDQTDQPDHQLNNCFPVYKINCGEKIVFDFEHEDGWTWIDEHSAPFSWKTKSQQDLTLTDLDELSNPKEECKKNRFTKRPRSPDKSIWETPAVFDDDKDKNEIEKMFERFGIKASTGDDNSDDDYGASVRKLDHAGLIIEETFASPSHVYSEQSKLLDDANEKYDNQNLAYEQDDSMYVRTSTSCDVNTIKAEMVEKNKDVVMIDDNVFGIVRMKQPTESTDTDKKKKFKKGKKEKTGKDKHSSVKEKSQLGELDISKFKNQPFTLPSFSNRSETVKDEENGFLSTLGSVSPVFVADMGVSSTNDIAAVHGSRLTSIIIANPGESSTDVFTSFSNHGSAVDNLGLSVSDLGLTSSTLLTNDSGRGDSIVKTGFDFLDEW